MHMNEAPKFPWFLVLVLFFLLMPLFKIVLAAGFELAELYVQVHIDAAIREWKGIR